jgi:hypothetical protein
VTLIITGAKFGRKPKHKKKKKNTKNKVRKSVKYKKFKLKTLYSYFFL